MIYMQQQTTESTNTVRIIWQVGRILLFQSSVLTGWFCITTLTAYTDCFVKRIASFCLWSSIAHLFPAKAGCPSCSLHISARSLPAESKKWTHCSHWGQQHNKLVKERKEKMREDGRGLCCTGSQGRVLQRAVETSTSLWCRIMPRKWKDAM